MMTSESSVDRLRRLHELATRLTVEALNTRGEMFDRLERLGLGMVEDDMVFHYFPKLPRPKLKGIAV